jgi:hypothetical protein
MILLLRLFFIFFFVGEYVFDSPVEIIVLISMGYHHQQVFAKHQHVQTELLLLHLVLFPMHVVHFHVTRMVVSVVNHVEMYVTVFFYNIF